ncbi:E2 [Macaca mulatta papillomavirus 7]|uniref:E2 n=1 Tax=Macaca mulatta papillomavirus 7 TaxID=2364644 RepID=UPI000EB77420|nr:E2 [Macaca mulatta papillomavirus 7]AYD74615.1 E2 [Macaca mulatta papillomavirus 7]
METRETLTARFDALQEQIMTLYERGAADLQTQILHWDLVRKENVLLYHSRKQGFMSLGLQPTPALQVSEYRAKEAIQMGILLNSLAKSQYANERWTLSDTSAQLLLTEPKYCFKKGAYQVEVYFDNDEANMFPYPNWNYIYYQDEEERWHKVAGLADYNGCYYDEENGDRVYFRLFEKDAAIYGRSGQWTVKYKNTVISAPVTSSTRPSDWYSGEAGDTSTSNTTTPEEKRETRRPHQQISTEATGPGSTSPSSTTHLPGRRRRRRSEQGEHSSTTRAKRRRTPSPGSAPSPEEVGRVHRSVEKHGLTRLGRIQAEARDPAVIIVKGYANSLKCWRRRIWLKHRSMYKDSSTVFNWVGDHNSNKHTKSRILLAFHSTEQRQLFLSSVPLPKGSCMSLGNLDSL